MDETEEHILFLQSLPLIAHNFVEINDTYDLNRADYLLCELEQCCTVFKFSPGAPHIVHAFSSHQMPNNVKRTSTAC